jgi:2-polyprenyl-3-methyl-5-hydroxy-6-metoxy-1,4-benzoquinol methylase
VDQHEQVERTPVALAETATVLSALPDLAGKSVLDVGAGAGHYPRLFRRRGAGRVIGVDASRDLIAYAQRAEERDPLGISFETHDPANLPVLGTFDVVTAIWVIGHAPGLAALDDLVARLAANLVRPGRLVALSSNPDLDWAAMTAIPHYGTRVLRTGESRGRTSILMRVQTDPPVEFESFAWSPGVVEQALERGGFTEVHRHAPVVPEDAVAEHGEEFWKPLRRKPTFAVYSAKRS